MNTTALFVELVVIGAGVLIWVVLCVFAVFGYGWMSVPTATIWLAALPSLAVVYVLGIVWDRVADEVFQHLRGRALRAEYFPEITDYYEARRTIFTQSEALSGLLEYGRSRLRICRGWCLNAICIGIFGEAAIWLNLGSHDQVAAIAVAFALAMALLAFGCWYAWLNLVRAEYRKVGAQAEFLRTSN